MAKQRWEKKTHEYEETLTLEQRGATMRRETTRVWSAATDKAAAKIFAMELAEMGKHTPVGRTGRTSARFKMKRMRWSEDVHIERAANVVRFSEVHIRDARTNVGCAGEIASEMKTLRERGFKPPKQPVATKLSQTAQRWQKWWLGLDEATREALSTALGFAGDPGSKQLEAFAKLEKLDLYEAGIADLKPLAALTSLHHLDLYGNVFSDLTPLTKLTKLTHLRIGNCAEVTSIAPLAKLTNLRDLDVSSTSITNLAPLAKLDKLRSLLLEGLSQSERQLRALEKRLPRCRISTAD